MSSSEIDIIFICYNIWNKLHMKHPTNSIVESPGVWYPALCGRLGRLGRSLFIPFSLWPLFVGQALIQCRSYFEIYFISDPAPIMPLLCQEELNYSHVRDDQLPSHSINILLIFYSINILLHIHIKSGCQNSEWMRSDKEELITWSWSSRRSSGGDQIKCY